MPREAALVQRIRKAVRAKYPGSYTLKIADRYTRGVPDLLIVFRRRNPMYPDRSSLDNTGVLFVETKTKDGVLSKIQEETLRQLRSISPNGCESLVVFDVETVLAALDMMGAVG